MTVVHHKLGVRGAGTRARLDRDPMGQCSYSGLAAEAEVRCGIHTPSHGADSGPNRGGWQSGSSC